RQVGKKMGINFGLVEEDSFFIISSVDGIVGMDYGFPLQRSVEVSIDKHFSISNDDGDDGI
ncbi:TPA: hypothetical protein ACTXXA_002002, partial [Legionella anisa]